MGSLIRVITDPTKAGYGVNLLEQFGPAPVQGASLSAVGIVGHFPWGPYDEIIEAGSVAELLQIVAPEALAASSDTTSYPALVALGARFSGPIRCVRISPAGALAATLSIDSGNAVATAAHPGAAGNEVSVQIAAATSGSGSQRNVIVTLGTRYRVVYEDLDVAGIAALTDPFVTFTCTALPAAGAAAPLAGGADGAPAAGDWTGSPGSGTGLDLFEDDASDASVVFCAGVASADVAAVNSGLKAFVDATQKPIFGVLNTPLAATAATVQGSVSTLRADRLLQPWPRVYVRDPFDPDGASVLTDGNADAAAAIAGVRADLSPGGASGKAFLGRIQSLESPSPSRATLDGLSAAGVAPFYLSTTQGPILRGGRTTDLDVRRRYVYRRRATDYITRSIGLALEAYAELPCDYSVNAQGAVTLGDVTAGEVGMVTGFLEGLRAAGQISGFAVDYSTGNDLAAKALGVLTLSIAVQLNGIQEVIILRHTIGAGVNLTTEA